MTDDQFTIAMLRHRFELRLIRWALAGIEARRVLKEQGK